MAIDTERILALRSGKSALTPLSPQECFLLKHRRQLQMLLQPEPPIPEPIRDTRGKIFHTAPDPDVFEGEARQQASV